MKNLCGCAITQTRAHLSRHDRASGVVRLRKWGFDLGAAMTIATKNLFTRLSRVASSLSVFCGPRPPHMVGNPSLRESVKLVLLCLGVIFWCVTHVNPVD